MPENCPRCNGPMEEGFVVTTNGSGLYWSKEEAHRRLRPHGLEVLVPTEFGGAYSATARARRCPVCRAIDLRLA